ncbi:MAG: hypothetical protein EZS28_029785 [Streblomastix strix]|uniref:Uncharacterized protein n=1 Tax=Streblomastix strix TaxID=222440 RepID=A0A5J4UW67_9EUKA|nr:MAG: hypothetical protein EZS28_029785 [Streblomastix strix]
MDDKEEAIKIASESQENEQAEIKLRRDISIENRKLETELEKLKKQIEKAKYREEIEEKEKEMNIAIEETTRRLLAEKKSKKEQIDRERECKRADNAEQRLNELQETLHKTLNNLMIKTEDYHKEKIKAEREQQKAIEEKQKRKETEILMGRIELQNLHLKRENYLLKRQRKEQIGEEKVDEEFAKIQQEMKQFNENLQLKEVMERERNRSIEYAVKTKPQEIDKGVDQVKIENEQLGLINAQQENNNFKAEISHIFPIAVIPQPIVPNTEHGQFVGYTFSISQPYGADCIIAFNPLIESVVFFFEVIFKKSIGQSFALNELRSLSIADASVSFEPDEPPSKCVYKRERCIDLIEEI